MAKKIGFIGGGNMASAIYGGILENHIAAREDIHVFDINRDKLLADAQRVGFQPAQSNIALVQECDVIFFAIKPQFIAQVLEEIRPYVRKEQFFISIVAGWSNEKIKAGLGQTGRVLRVMPNTPLLVGEGMSCLCAENDLSEEEFAFAKQVFSGMGCIQVLPEKQIAAFASIAGSGPAYTYMFIEALADAGCADGLPRNLCYRIASQMVLGSAKMVLETQTHPGALKDAVCSPGGTTIEAVYALEKEGFRGAVMKAVKKCTEKFNRL